VRFHERRVTGGSREVKYGRRSGLEDSDAWIKLAFSVRLAERYRARGGIDNEGANILKRTEPAFIEPMQCKPVVELPAGEKWTFEIKLDGYRCIAVKRGGEVTLFSRHQKLLNGRFPGVVDALASLKGDFVLDGELVAFDSQGRPSFQILQNVSSNRIPISFYAFDLLNRNGELLVCLPLSERGKTLGILFARTTDALRLSPLLETPSGQILEAVRKLGLEGVVGKRLDSRYEPGQRSGAWVKLRANLEQEFVIGGYIPCRVESPVPGRPRQRR
jgi:ATP-dependent DNA ligase